MSTTKEQKENAKNFYHSFMENSCSQAAIVAKTETNNVPFINKVQFLAVIPGLAFGQDPVVIAESIHGIAGCFTAFLKNIKEIDIKKSYFNNDVNEWLKENFGFEISYKDGYVIMLNKGKANDWIPVSSGVLPDEKEVVQVTYLSYLNKKPYCDEFAYMKNGKWHWNEDDKIPLVKITAWRYPTKPYEEEQRHDD